MELTLASGNPHKADELTELLPSFSIILPKEKIPVEETGDTFFANSEIKAQSYHEKFNTPALADDSGLIVDALPGELGVKSARFGGDGLSDQDRTNLLLQKMEGVKNRSACFICVLCFYISSTERFFFEGRLQGKISLEARGEKGFGYDPVFIPRSKKDTLAMLPQWKKENSHRAKAARAALKFFK